MTSLNTVITSPFYPSNYPDQTTCNYRFIHSRPQNYRLYVHFYMIDIEDSESCAADSLSIYDGNSTNAPLIDTICGRKSGIRYMTTGNSLFIQFKSNDNVTKRGFSAYFYQRFMGKYLSFFYGLRLFSLLDFHLCFALRDSHSERLTKIAWLIAFESKSKSFQIFFGTTTKPYGFIRHF